MAEDARIEVPPNPTPLVAARVASRLRDYLPLAADDVGDLRNLDPYDRYRAPLYDLHAYSNKPEDWVEPDWWIQKRPEPRR